MKKFWAGGFLYNPDNNSVLLHQRDAKTKFNPNAWAFFGGLNEGTETPLQCFIRELSEELGCKLEDKILFLWSIILMKNSKPTDTSFTCLAINLSPNSL